MSTSEDTLGVETRIHLASEVWAEEQLSFGRLTPESQSSVHKQIPEQHSQTIKRV